MFDLFRSREKSVRFMLGALLLVVSAGMLVYLIPGGVGGPSASGQNVIAAVGDQKITTVDLDRSIQRITRGQANLPKGLLAMYVPTLVNQMIESKALAYKAREIGLHISDQELSDRIAAEVAPALGGKFDFQVYQSALAQQGMTVADFENEQREAMLGARLENIELQSLIVSDADARAEYQRKNLKVGLQYIQFDPKNFVSKVDKSEAAVKGYFDKHRSEFRTPETRDLGLIVGSTADFIQSANISDAQLQQEYNENIDSYRLPERVKVRHILIKTQGKPKDEIPALKAKAEDILKQLQHGGNFAELAKKYSDDPGSAQKGGELDPIVHGQTVPNFEKAAFSLKPGETSGLIETEYGYHIIQCEQKFPAHTETFDEVKPQLLMEAKRQAASDNLRKAIDSAHSEIGRNPSQAEAIAKKYNLKYFPVSGFVNSGSLPDVNRPPDLINSIFNTSKNNVTEIASLDPQGKQAFAVVTGITPAHDADYASVQADVVKKYTEAQSEQLAEQAAKAAADRARKGESLEAIAKSYGAEVKTAAPFTIDGAAEGIGSASQLSAAFKDNVGDIVGPVATSTGQFVCRVSEKIPADMSQFAANKNAIVQSLQQQRQTVQGPLFRDSIVNDLKRRGKIKINEATLTRIINSYQG
ncbi:MAG TPA: peptidylprolyl isomerase [Bryobacteraceae bacterium]|jgi:peptidyl-prolyl cis-trans isomerase D|nr:peptidylprolyl isomerase [Bryobacteraceae bacterium]